MGLAIRDRDGRLLTMNKVVTANTGECPGGSRSRIDDCQIKMSKSHSMVKTSKTLYFMAAPPAQRESCERPRPPVFHRLTVFGSGVSVRARCRVPRSNVAFRKVFPVLHLPDREQTLIENIGLTVRISKNSKFISIEKRTHTQSLLFLFFARFSRNTELYSK